MSIKGRVSRAEHPPFISAYRDKDLWGRSGSFKWAKFLTKIPRV